MESHDWSRTHAEVRPHDHAVHVYDEQDDLLEPLEAFLHDGLKRRELTTFVHSFDRHEHAREFVSRRVDDVGLREQNHDLTMAAYREAFERGGRIDYDHVGGIVQMLQGSARASGRESVRIFVDASRNYFDAGRVDEWFAFESWLGPKLAAEAGLVCAYRAKDLENPGVLARVLATHGYRFGLPARKQA